MSGLVNASINLEKIEKSKIIKGKKGSYINVTVFINDEKDEYGNNASVIMSQTKEEREAKTDRVYLGNGIFYGNNKPSEVKVATDGLPF
jgi:hypothetical protein